MPEIKIKLKTTDNIKIKIGGELNEKTKADIAARETARANAAKQAADVNGDGKANIKDLVRLKKAEYYQSLTPDDFKKMQAEIDNLYTILDKANTMQTQKNAETNILTKKGAASNKAFAERKEKQAELNSYLRSAGYGSINDVKSALEEKLKKREEISSLFSAEYAQEQLQAHPKTAGSSQEYQYWKNAVGNIKYQNIVSKLDEDVIESAKEYSVSTRRGAPLKTNTAALTKLQKLGYSKEESLNIIDYIKDRDQAEKNAELLQNVKTNYHNANGLEKTAIALSSVVIDIAGIPSAVLGTVSNAIKELSGSDVPTNSLGNEYFLTNTSRAIKQAMSEDIENEAVDFLAQTGLSILNWLAVTGLTMGVGTAAGLSTKAVSALSLGTMGAQAGGNTAVDTLEKGGNYTQALITGAASAATEILTEKIALDSWTSILTNKTGIKNSIVKSLMQQGFSEAGEETLAQIANFAVDAVVMGDKSDYEQKVKELMAQGYDEQTARSKAILAMGGQVALAGLGGLLSGVAIGGTTSAIYNGVQNKTTKAIGYNIIGSKNTTTLADLANKYQVDTNNVNENDAKQVGKVWTSVNQKINAEIKALQTENDDVQSNVTETVPGAAVENSKNIDKNNIMATAAVHTLNELNADLELLAAIAMGKNLSAVNAEPVENDTVNTEETLLQENGLTNQNGYSTIESGGENYAGPEQNGDSSERLGRGVSVGEETSGAVQGADGRVYSNSQGIGNAAGTFEILSNSKNNRGQIRALTAEESGKLNGTAIVNDDGSPKLVSHFTDNMEFETFGEGDIGFHFGTEEQAITRGRKKNVQGRIIRAYLNIKNPIRVDTDIMNWHPNAAALKLFGDGVLSLEESTQIHNLQMRSGQGYNSPAAIELRNILSQKGYDGIVYDNFIEGDGQSYIALYPEQVIIVDNGINKDSEAAFNDGAFFVAETDSAFTEPSASSPKDATPLQRALGEMYGNPVLTEDQKTIKSIGKKLGWKVLFDNVYVKDAQGNKVLDKMNRPIRANADIDFKSRTITIDFNCKKPVQFLFKHELTHFGETSELYQDFVNAIRASSVYLQWLQTITGENIKSVGKLEGIYRDMVMESRKSVAPVGIAEAQQEMYADFCGDVLFSNNQNALNRLMDSLDKKERPKFIQFILDFITYLKEKIAGNKQITLELVKLENKFAEMLNDAKENTDQIGGVSNNRMSAIKFSHDINEYPYDMQSVIVEYLNSSDADFISFINDARKETNKKRLEYMHYDLKNNFNDNALRKITDILGFDISKYQISINGESVHHIDKRHGKNGKHDRSMKNDLDWSRAQYILTNADSVIHAIDSSGKKVFDSQYRDKNNEPSKVLLISKKINGTYFIALAAPDSQKSTLHIKSMFISKKIEDIQEFNVKDPELTPEANLEVSSKNIIDESEKKIKQKLSAGDIENISQTQHRDIPSEMQRLIQQRDNGEIDADTFTEQMNTLYAEANERYGVIPEGENAATPIYVPQKVAENKVTKRFVRTILETGKLDAEMIEGIEQEILLGDIMSYEPISDKSAMDKANEAVKRGTAEMDWQGAVNSNGLIGKRDIAIGEKLLLEAQKNKDKLRVVEIGAELADMFTRGGQVVQAAKLLKRMSGLGRLIIAQRNIKSINRSLQDKYSNKKDIPKVELDPLLAQQLVDTKNLDDAEIVYQNILQDTAAQVPSTFLDKLNAWRYFAMLANPRTHLRNLISNGVFVPAVRIKDAIATGMEHMLVKDVNQRTKSFHIKKEYLEFAKKDIKTREAKSMLQDSGMLDDKGQIDSMRKTFETDWLEKLIKSNSNWLEVEDMWFKSVHYKRAFAGFLQARKADLKAVDSKTLKEARAYAVKEAKKATFQDASILADILKFRTPRKYQGRIGVEYTYKALRLATEGVLPFKRTPINIVKRGIEYSPLGVIERITVGLKKVRSGEITVTEYIDGWAAALTGTGLMALGWLLASAGWAVGGFGNDEEDKFKQLNGEQEYSLVIFGKSYSIDWAAPSAIPFFIGVEIAQELEKDGNIALKDITASMWNALEPITNLSMLSGIQGVISAVKYEDESQTVGSVVAKIGTTYLMQYVPSALGAISRTTDSTQRTWYYDKNLPFGRTTQNLINNFKSKIPGLSYTQAPKIDAWGRTESRGNIVERIMENFISPGYYSDIDYNEVDNELLRLAKETGGAVFPKQADKYFTVNKETKNLTAEEWVAYATAKGEYSFDYIHDFVNDKDYEKLTNEQCVEVIGNLYSYANAKAKASMSDYDILSSEYKKAFIYERNGGDVIEYYIRRSK